MRIKTFIAAMLLGIISVFAQGIFAPTSAQTTSGQIVIETQKGPVQISVEYAVTPEQRAKGLMGRTSLPARHGMLFIYGQPQQVVMWMKDTPLSLDMFFINRRGIIRKIEERTEPNSTRKISAGGRVVAVLELSGGSAKRLGIKAGDRVVLPQ